MSLNPRQNDLAPKRNDSARKYACPQKARSSLTRGRGGVLRSMLHLRESIEKYLYYLYLTPQGFNRNS